MILNKTNGKIVYFVLIMVLSLTIFCIGKVRAEEKYTEDSQVTFKEPGKESPYLITFYEKELHSAPAQQSPIIGKCEVFQAMEYKQIAYLSKKNGKGVNQIWDKVVCKKLIGWIQYSGEGISNNLEFFLKNMEKIKNLHSFKKELVGSYGNGDFVVSVHFDELKITISYNGSPSVSDQFLFAKRIQKNEWELKNDQSLIIVKKMNSNIEMKIIEDGQNTWTQVKERIFSLKTTAEDI